MAEDAQTPPAEKAAEKTPAKPQDKLVTTQHSILLNGQELKYTVTAGTIVLKEEDDKEGHKPKAELFFVAYTKDGVENVAQRPLTFSFNGGPGSSSVWLHLGVLGPRRVPVSPTNDPLPPPYQLVDNEYTLLEESDLVFIDPVSTGYSRKLAGKDENPHEFHGYQRDIESVGEFIRLYTSRYKRWPSPKFLIGESYGTTRAAGLSGYLQERHGMYLNGIMLVSSILDFQTASFKPGNDLPYILFLPTYAATAWYHKKAARRYHKRPLPRFLEDVQEFAETEYALALMQGDKLGKRAYNQVVKKLAGYTGLSEKYIQRTNLRINIHRFVKEILRDEGYTVGRFDSRLTGRDRDEVGENHEHDPSYDIVQGVYTACFNDYVRSELQFETDLPYEILSWRVFPAWKYDTFQNQYVNTAEVLRASMTKNPYLKVLVANGYFDLATPHFATEYTFSHLGLKPELQGNVSMTYYEAGHMMYLHQPSLAKLKQDLGAFIQQAK